MTPLYTTEATSTGGRNGRASLKEGGLALAMSLPGSNLPGANPEQLFALGYAACFNQAILVVGGKHKAEVQNASVNVKVTLGKTDAGGFALAAEIGVKLPGVESGLAQKIVEEAHQICPYSNATRGNMPVTVKVL